MSDAPLSRGSFAEVRRQQFYPKSDGVFDDAWLQGLASSKSTAISLDAARDAVRSHGITVRAIRPLVANGTFHELFTVEDAEGHPLVLKVNRASDRLVDYALLTELTVSNVLNAASIPHGRILAADCTRQYATFDFQVVEFVPGESFRTFDEDEGRVLAQTPALATYLREVHTIEGEGFGLLTNQGESGQLAGAQSTWLDYLMVRSDEHVARILFPD